MAYFTLQVFSDHSTPVPVGDGGTTVTAVDGGVVYYGDTPQVGAALNRGSLTNGQSVTFTTGPLFVRSTVQTSITVLIVGPQLPASELPASLSTTALANYLPPGWNTTWLAAKAGAQAGTGVARVAVVMGGSDDAGQSGGTVTDCLKYGWVGRLKSMLLQSMALSADGFTLAGVGPYTGTPTPSPSGPYAVGTGGGGGIGTGSYTIADGAAGYVWTPTSTGAFLTIYLPKDYDTGAYPAAGPGGQFADIYTLDFNTNTWTWNADSGAATGTITGLGSGSVGAALMRRTSITGLAGGQTHNIALSEGGANGLPLYGHVTYYGTTGLQIFRNAVPGVKAVDYAVGGGSGLGSSLTTAGNSLSPDKIAPWGGTTGPWVSGSTPAFPFSGLDLAIIIPGDDAVYGTHPDAAFKALCEMVEAVRRGNPATATSPGVSVLIVLSPFVSMYSDNTSIMTGAQAADTFRYAEKYLALARRYRCGLISGSDAFGLTPVARGLMAAGNPHMTQNGGGAGGGDGHLLLAQTVLGVI